MSARIGILLPRSTEYPSLGFDLLDGIRLGLKHLGVNDVQFFMENTGFGEDPSATQALAEKLVMRDDVHLIIAYATSLNAEALYAFAETASRPFLFLDAGMEIFEAPPHRLCRHITLQGLMSCKKLGEKAGQDGGKVISAVSFFDGGYRSSWAFCNAIAANGGSICGNFVSHFKEEDFNLQPLFELIRQGEAQSVTAAFSSYFAEWFMRGLKAAGDPVQTLPFYCSPFMADEQLLNAIPFPGGNFHTVVAWARTLENENNRLFTEVIQKEKNKAANLFHLLGWEAALAASRIITDGIAALDDWSYESPRGTVRFHPATHTSYGPLYEGRIEADEQGNCRLALSETIHVSAEEHSALHFSKPEGEYSRWKNNYFCI